MAAPAPGQPRGMIDIIDLLDDDDDDDDDNDNDTDSDSELVREADRPAQMRMPLDDEFAPWNLPPRQAVPPNGANDVHDAQIDEPNHQPARGGAIINIDGEEVFIPDDEDGDYFNTLAYDGLAEAATAHDQDLALSLQEAPVATFDDCLPRVLEIFPDISHEYVQTLYDEFDHAGGYETLPPQARLDNIIEQLVSNPFYPKQEKGKKRKREDSRAKSPKNQWESKDRLEAPPQIRTAMKSMLKVEFPEIPVQYINDTLAAERYFYHAYVLLARTHDCIDGTNRPYGKGRPSSRYLADADTIVAATPWPGLSQELAAARECVQGMRAERAAERAKREEEQENLNRAIAAGETAECSACYEDLPMNRQLHCNGSVAHFACFECMERYIKSEVGDSRCRVLCPAGCGAGFAHNQLDLLADKGLLDKLAQLQQEKDIRDADLDDLEECPFCDYKAILPPIEEDFEFRCANPDCEKVSCRRCKAVSHIPFSCEEHAKNNKVNSRHKIEEAMTAALVRSCNKCKKQFIKDFGCNKMTCPSCGNLQCYVCSASLRDYNHFEQNHPRSGAAPSSSKSKACPLYDNVEERHEREVREAEAAARAQIFEENPDITAEDLEIKMSDAVEKATADRIQRLNNGGHLNFLGFVHPPLGAGNAVGILNAAARRGEVDEQVRPHLQQRALARAARRAQNRLVLERMRHQHLQHHADGRPWPVANQADANAQFGQAPQVAWQVPFAPHPARPELPLQAAQAPLQGNEPPNGIDQFGDEMYNNLGLLGDGAADINHPALPQRLRPALGDAAPFYFNRNEAYGHYFAPGPAPALNVQVEQQMQHMMRDLGRLGPYQQERPAQQPQQAQLHNPLLLQARQQQQQLLQLRLLQQQQRMHLDHLIHRGQPPQPALDPNGPNRAGRFGENAYQNQEQRRAMLQNLQAMEAAGVPHIGQQPFRLANQQNMGHFQPQQPAAPHQDAALYDQEMERYNRDMAEIRRITGSP